MAPNATDAYNQLQSFSSSRPAATSYLDQANQKYGVDAANTQVSGLQTTIGNLQNAAAAVAPSVAGRTSGTFTTQGQRDALVNREQAPIITNLNSQGQQLGQAQSAQQQAQAMAGQFANGLAAQDQQKYQSLLDNYNAANAADQFQQQQQAAAQQAAADQAYKQQTLAEQIREFNNPQNSGASIASELMALQGNRASTPAVTTSGASGQPVAHQQQNDYNFVKGLIGEVQNADTGSFKLILNQAKSGDARSKDILRSYYQLQHMPVPASFKGFL